MQTFLERFEMRDTNIDITMMTFHTDMPETCGVVELDGRGAVKAFHEKVKSPPSHLANAAVYIIAPAVIDFIQELGKEIVDFSTEILPHYMGRINTFHNDVYHRDIGNLKSLNLAQGEYPLAVAMFKKRLTRVSV
jgi:mannose-1-phosphate guanylyltransferase